MKSPLQPKPQRGGGEKEQWNQGPEARWYRDRQDRVIWITNEWFFISARGSRVGNSGCTLCCKGIRGPVARAVKGLHVRLDGRLQSMVLIRSGSRTGAELLPLPGIMKQFEHGGGPGVLIMRRDELGRISVDQPVQVGCR